MTNRERRPAHEEPVTNDKIVLRPLIGLMQGRSPADIERFTIAELEKHRRLREEAVRLEARCSELRGDAALSEVESDLVTAMIAVHAQQTVVSTLLDILGFIPKMPANTAH